jgi:hypothetical protein
MKIMYRTIAVVLISMELVFTTGCVNPNGTQNNTGTGALIGGAIGALAGAAGGGRYAGQRAFFGAAIGAVSGALIGNMIDQEQRQRLQQQSPQTWNKIQNNDAVYANSPPPVTPPPTTVFPQTLDSAQAIDGGTSLSLPPGSQFYAFGMATGGARDSSPFANGQTVSLSNVAGITSAELATTTANNNNFPTSTAYHAIAGFGASHFNYVQGFYGANPNSGAHSVSVQFTLSTPALVALLGTASGQQYLVFSGLPNFVTDVPYTTSDATSIGHAYLSAGTYTAQLSSLDTAAGQTPAYMADLLGVYIFSTSPNAASSSNPQIPLPAFQPPPSTSLAATPSTSPTATATSAPQMQPITVDDIKALASAGVKDSVVTAEIQRSNSKFSQQDITELQQAHVSQPVIEYIQKNAAS